IAHKTGTLTYIRGDAGIIFTQKPFVISVFVRGTDLNRAETIIAEIGKIAYEALK
ncbi:MAG TPA: serine hydrolase, partial [Runella sp.]|nr:serine hydrolase [Runella sp.]